MSQNYNHVLVHFRGILVSCIFCLSCTLWGMSTIDAKYYDEEHEEAYMTTPELIVRHGYPFELHEVTTEDGYILELHRIPHGKVSGSEGKARRTIWLQHGLLCDSSSWIMNTEDKSLAYVLADAGYDVWLGNIRGNTYSKKHVSLSADDDQFWDFSWDDMGHYDVPAILHYIIPTSGQPTIYYAGHSMGTTVMFVALSTYPALNSKVRLFNALAPIAYITHMKSAPLKFIAAHMNLAEWLLNLFGIKEFLPSSYILRLLETTSCDETSVFEGLCENIVFLIAGSDSKQFNHTMFPLITGHIPAGASVKSILHYGQCVNSGRFQRYDYGKEKNLKLYGQEVPPSYNLSKVIAPTALYWGENDCLGPPEDVAQTRRELGNVVLDYRVDFPEYSHLDFLFATDNDRLLNKPLLEFMENY